MLYQNTFVLLNNLADTFLSGSDARLHQFSLLFVHFLLFFFPFLLTFGSSLDTAFEALDDLVTDIPSCANIAASYISQAVLVGGLPLDSLRKLEKLRATETFPTVVKHVLTKVAEAPNVAEIKEALA